MKALPVLAVGIDLCNLRRIDATFKQFGERFLNRVYTDWERDKFYRKGSYKAAIGFLGRRWAAKEACAKALGTGFSQGVRPCTIETRNLGSGQPYIVLYGTAKQHLQNMSPRGALPHILVSLTDDAPFAFCEVMIIA